MAQQIVGQEGGYQNSPNTAEGNPLLFFFFFEKSEIRYRYGFPSTSRIGFPIALSVRSLYIQ